ADRRGLGTPPARRGGDAAGCRAAPARPRGARHRLAVPGRRLAPLRHRGPARRRGASARSRGRARRHGRRGGRAAGPARGEAAVSDDIEIRHGAVVAVDSRSLRGAAAQLDEIAGRLAEAAEAAGAAGWALADVDAVLHGGWSAQASGLRAEAEGAGAAARRAALRLRAAAAVYEHAELTARRAVTLDDAARTAIDARLAE